jgi:hypothetical protein
MSLANTPHDGTSPMLAPTVVQEEAIVDNLDLLLDCLPGEIVASIRELSTRQELAAGRDSPLATSRFLSER